jgi:hypothetical protein
MYIIYICFRPVENIRGFSRETVIEVTTNIESQEYRRRENEAIGYPEHPRAGGTDNLETFFGIVHMNLVTTFTLKQFKHYWPKAVRYFSIMFILRATCFNGVNGCLRHAIVFTQTPHFSVVNIHHQSEAWWIDKLDINHTYSF